VPSLCSARTAHLVRNAVQLFAAALGATSLAACAQSSVVANKSELVSANQVASLDQRGTSFVTNRRVAFAKKRTLFASNKTGAERQIVSNGLASFYTEGIKTASGERLDTHKLTAAHPTLRFGTRLRVTSLATGRSVTVRVNDRGPFFSGRVVDVSYAAAEMLGMIGGGIAKVKVDVVQYNAARSRSTVPYRADETVHRIIDRFSTGAVYREPEIKRTEFETVVSDLLTGQFDDPVRVVAFNTVEHWVADVAADIAANPDPCGADGS
jgi:rare lipoprotein A